MLSKVKSFFSKPIVLLSTAVSVIVIAVAAVLAFNAFASNPLSEYYYTFETDAFYYYNGSGNMYINVYSQNTVPGTATWQLDATTGTFTDSNDESGESISIVGDVNGEMKYFDLNVSIPLSKLSQEQLDSKVWLYQEYYKNYSGNRYYRKGYVKLSDLISSDESILVDGNVYIVREGSPIYFDKDTVQNSSAFVDDAATIDAGYSSRNYYYLSIEQTSADSYTSSSVLYSYSVNLYKILGAISDCNVEYKLIEDVLYNTYPLKSSTASENGNFYFATNVTIPFEKLDVYSNLSQYLSDVKIEVYQDDTLIETVTYLEGQDWLTSKKAYACYLNINDYTDYVRAKDSDYNFSSTTTGSYTRIPIAVKLKYDYSRYDESKITDPDNLAEKQYFFSRDLAVYTSYQEGPLEGINMQNWLDTISYENGYDAWSNGDKRLVALGDNVTYSPSLNRSCALQYWRVKDDPDQTYSPDLGELSLIYYLGDADLSFDDFDFDQNTGFFTYTVEVEPVFEDCVAKVYYHDIVSNTDTGTDADATIDYVAEKEYPYQYKDADGNILDTPIIEDAYASNGKKLTFVNNNVEDDSYPYSSLVQTFHFSQRIAYWNTKADGTGTQYKSGKKIDLSLGDVHLYAQWVDINYYIIYHANSPTGNDADVSGMPANMKIKFNRSADYDVYQRFLSVDEYYGSKGYYWLSYKDGNQFNTDESNLISPTAGDGEDYSFYGWANSLPKNQNEFYNNSYAYIYADPDDEDYWNGNNGVFKERTDGDYEYNAYALWSSSKYRVTYHTNVAADDKAQPTGSVPVDTTDYMFEDTATVLGNTGGLARNGYVLTGWNTKADGSGTVFSLDENGVITGSNTTIKIMGGVALYAQWEKLPTYTVKYNKNVPEDDKSQPTGNVPTDENEYLLNDTATVLGNTLVLARRGYILTGWNTQADGKGTMYALDENGVITGDNTTITVSGNLVLYAQWTKLEYILNYKENPKHDGAKVEGMPDPVSINLTIDDFISDSGDLIYKLSTATPDSAGYIFHGWGLASNSSTNDTRTSVPLANFIKVTDEDTGEVTYVEDVYAVWERIEYTLTYNANGFTADSGTMPSPATVTLIIDNFDKNSDDEYIYTLSTRLPTTTGYECTGWGMANNSTTAVTTVKLSNFAATTNDLTVYAIWNTVEYSVQYVANAPSDSSVDSDSMPDNETGLTVTNGLQKDADGNYFHTISDKVPTATGYKFKGWKVGGNDVSAGGNVLLSYFSSNNTAMLYAQWNKLSYTVEYYDKDGTKSLGSKEYPYKASVKIGDGASTPELIAGKKHTGWEVFGSNTTDAGNNAIGTEDFPMPANTIKFKAVYTDEEYTVTYKDSRDASALFTDSAKYKYNAAATVKSVTDAGFSHGGYYFTSWNTKADGSGTAYSKDSTITITADVELYAQWAINEYDVTYKDGYSNDTNKDVVYNVNHGGTHTVQENMFTRIGWNFTGWSVSPDTYSAVAGDSITVTENVTYTANWEQIEYTVTYTVKGAPSGVTAPTDTTAYHYGDKVNVKAALSATGYSFKGWTLGDTDYAAGTSNASFTITDNVTLTGVFTKLDEVSLVYMANGGTPDSALPAQESDYTKLTTTVKAPGTGFGKTGYTFTGWNTNADGSGRAYSAGDDIEITANTYLYAQWSINSYKVNYYNSKDTLIISKSYDYNSAVTVNDGVSAPAIAGKTFKGWKLVDASQKDAGGKLIGERSTFNMPASDVSYKATYSDIEYKVTYTVQGGPSGVTAPTDDTVYYYGNTVNVAAALSAEGYSFKGWTLGGTDYAAGTSKSTFTITDDVTLVGTFSALDKVTLTYMANGGTPESALPAQKFAYTELTTTVEAPGANFGKTGYKFTGWNTQAGGKGTAYTAGDAISITKNTQLYAQWSKDTFDVEYYDINGKSLLSTKKYTYEGTVTVGAGATAPEIAGKTFKGWKLMNQSQTDSTGALIGTNSKFSMPAETVRFKAEYTDIEYTVSYTVSGNLPDGYTAPTDNNKYYYDNTVNVFAAPTAEGYTFTGWTLDGTDYAAGTDNESFKITENVTLVGVWTKNAPTTAKISYQSGIDCDDPNDPLAKKYTFEVALGEDYTVLDNAWFNVPGKKFNGWKVVARNVTGVSFLDTMLARFIGPANIGDILMPGDVVTNINEDITFEVNWEDVIYSVTYDGNGATSGTVPIDDNDYLYGDKAKVKPVGDLEKDEFDFVAWNTDPYGNGTSYTADSEMEIKDNVTLYAIWKMKPEYTVTYDTNGATSGTAPIDPDTYKTGEVVTVLDKGDLVQEGCTFREWNTNWNGRGTVYQADDTFEMGEENVTLYAIWVDDEGKVISPRTGEGSTGIWIAVAAMIMSVVTGGYVISAVYNKKRKNV